MPAQILSTGRYVPEKVMTNADFEPLLGESVDAWLVANVGIRERHLMAPDQVTSDLCVAAARQALERAHTAPTDLNLIVVATDTPDYISPGTSVVVQHKLGAVHAGTFDVNSACAGWVTALDIGARFIATDPEQFRRVLVIGGYGMSRYVNWHDKKTATLFADGAGAVVLGPGTGAGWLGTRLIAAGEFHDALGIYTGGTKQVAAPEHPTQYVEFVRKFPKTFNSDRWPVLIREVAAKAGLTPDDIHRYYFTQLNLGTIKLTMEALNQPLSKTHWIMDKWGYTGSACIPMVLDDALEQGVGPRPGEYVVFCASGGGLSMAVSLWQWV